MSGADDFVVVGYTACRCGQWMVEVIPGTSIALCRDCRERVGSEAHAQQFRYEAEGRVITAKPRKPRKPKQRKAKNQTSEQRDTRQRRDRARHKALWRLGRIYRPMYEVLYAEELVREGLDPDVQKGRPRPKAISAELLRDISDAAERETVHGDGLRTGT